MDQDRFTALMKKRDAEGLTAEEANELGKMLAERAGRTYGSAGERTEDVAREAAEVDYRDAVVSDEIAKGLNRGLWNPDPVDPDRPARGEE
jgi:hypothetical protein